MDHEDQDTSYLTMADLLKLQEEREETSLAVLGGSDEQNCTYSKGYVDRQAVFACLTCVPEARDIESKRSGICLACTLQCHEGHDMLELYTKRKFRCDCGGKRMPNVTCKLEPRKDDENKFNRYNQNFSGKYCICHRPCPDPENDEGDAMVQCVICEDWYHTRHLGLDDPKKAEDSDEMICADCMEANPFLKNYVGKIEELNKKSLNDTVQVDVTGLDETNASVTEPDADKPGPSEPKRIDDSKATGTEEKAKDKPAVLDICTMPPLCAESEKAYKKGASLWTDGWRKYLCQCNTCIEMYKKHSVEFLLNENDTIRYYEALGKQRLGPKVSAYEQGMQMLSQFDQVTQVDFLTEFNIMKVRLREFLDQFVANQQVVTPDDVNAFFANLYSERRESRSAGGRPPHFCR